MKKQKKIDPKINLNFLIDCMRLVTFRLQSPYFNKVNTKFEIFVFMSPYTLQALYLLGVLKKYFSLSFSFQARDLFKL
jgi:predicted methyltransferase